MVDLCWKQCELLLVLNLDGRDGEKDEARGGNHSGSTRALRFDHEVLICTCACCVVIQWFGGLVGWMVGLLVGWLVGGWFVRRKL